MMTDRNKHLGGFERPTTEGSLVTATPTDATMIALLGIGCHFEGVAFTRDQSKRLERFYGFDDQKARAEYEQHSRKASESREQQLQDELKKPNLSKRTHDRLSVELDKIRAGREASAKGAGDFGVAGNLRNRLRIVREDGLRVMALLSKYLEPGEDPVKLVLLLLDEAGYDTGGEFEWASELPEDDDESQLEQT